MTNNNFKPVSYHIIVGDRSREALQLEEADPGRPVKSRSSVPAQPHVDFFHTGFCISAQPHANFFLTGFCISSQTHTWISSALDNTFLDNHSWIFSTLNFVLLPNYMWSPNHPNHILLPHLTSAGLNKRSILDMCLNHIRGFLPY